MRYLTTILLLLFTCSAQAAIFEKEGADKFAVEIDSYITLTLQDSGKTIICTNADDATYVTLPPMVAGLKYRISAGAAQSVYIDTYGTEQIQYLTLDAGDGLISAGAKGDLIELYSDGSSWYVTDTGASAWTDGGAGDW